MLGTNLSVKLEDGSWDTETKRLCLMDRRDFNELGIGIGTVALLLVFHRVTLAGSPPSMDVMFTKSLR